MNCRLEKQILYIEDIFILLLMLFFVLLFIFLITWLQLFISSCFHSASVTKTTSILVCCNCTR